MKSDPYANDPQVIEANLARERAALTASIHNLRSNLSTEGLLDEATAFAKSKLGPLSLAVDSAVRANPIAAGLAAVGIAWLIFGRKSAPDSYANTVQAAIGRWEDEGGPVHSDDSVNSDDSVQSDDVAWIAETDSLQTRARAALADLEQATRARLRPAADLARERAAIVADVAANTRAAMARGLNAMSESAREQIIAARERAYAARTAFTQKGTALIEDHPFVTGAIALAAGAALAARIPVTATENRILGPERDHLFATAQSLLQAERARLADTTRAA